MRQVVFRIVILAAMIFQLFAVRQGCWAQDTGKLGILMVPGILYLPETGFGAGGLCMLTRSHAGGWTSMEACLFEPRAKLGFDASDIAQAVWA